MVRLAADDGPGAVELLQQHEVGDLVVEHTLREAHDRVRPRPDVGREAVRATDAEHDPPRALVACSTGSAVRREVTAGVRGAEEARVRGTWSLLMLGRQLHIAQEGCRSIVAQACKVHYIWDCWNDKRR